MKNFTVYSGIKFKRYAVYCLAVAIVLSIMTFVWLFVRDIDITENLVVMTLPLFAFYFWYQAVKNYFIHSKFRIEVNGDEISYACLGEKQKFNESDICTVVIAEANSDFNPMATMRAVTYKRRNYIDVYLNNGSRIRFPQKYQNADLFLNRFRGKKKPLSPKERR